MSSTTEIRKIIEDFVYGDFDEIEPSDYLTQEEIKDQNEFLDSFGLAFETEISDYAIDGEWDIFDLEEYELRRIFLFTKGIQEHMVIMSPDGQIPVVNTEIDTQLLLQVANTINSLCELIDDDFS
tara:strand:- start:188 stop:562 length:375 start_codon:yes stop_codon:yes gene_type:complete